MSAPVAARQLRRVAVASAIGTTIEWYDYFIYSTATALVFGKLFFTSLSPASGTLAAFATLGVGFLARPVGGILWGHFGDRAGRKAMLVLSLLLMGLATVGVGLLPTYSAIGVWAPILLLVLRLLQGLSAGGEWGGAALMAVEHAPEGRRGRYGAFSQIGVPAGLILAQLLFFVLGRTLTDAQFAAWGWRVPFLASIVLVGVGLVIRLRIEESPVFALLREEDARSSRPMVDVLRERPRALLVASGSFIANTAIGYIFLAYLLSYGTSVLKIDRTTLLVVVIVGSVTWLVSILVTAAWSDRVGRKPVYLAGSVLLVGLADPVLPAGGHEGHGLADRRGGGAEPRPRRDVRAAVGVVRGAVRAAVPLQRRVVLLRGGRGAGRRVRAADRDGVADRPPGLRFRCRSTWSAVALLSLVAVLFIPRSQPV